MMKPLKYLVVIGLLFFTPSVARAVWIVDTGPGPTVRSDSYYTVNPGQFIAGNFNLGQAYDITGIYGWMWPGTVNMTFTIAVYGDGGQIPDAANQLFAQQAVASNSGINWNGLSGLSLALNPGSYWAAFEARANDTFDGTMPQPATSPLADYAFYNINGWQAYDGLGSGIRISGDLVPGLVAAPEAASLLLVGLGLIGIAGVRKYRK